MKRSLSRLSMFLSLTGLGWSQNDLNRTVLPIPDPQAPVITNWMPASRNAAASVAGRSI
ncbi:MAG: hypothetical protein JO266_21230 [Acidobacteria bacterium]|nr:hypothetical protein [Acidobacteriota bacterium]